MVFQILLYEDIQGPIMKDNISNYDMFVKVYLHSVSF